MAPDGIGSINPEDAPYLDPQLVHDPEWLLNDSKPRGREHAIIYRLSPSSLVQMIRHPRDFTFVDKSFAFGSDEEFFRLTRRFCEFSEPTAEESFCRVTSKQPRNGRALALATGPSAEAIDRSEFEADLRITCNSAIRDRSLLEEMRPNLIAFSDPVFHFGPSRYASQFRRDLKRVFESSDAIFVTSSYFVAPLLIAMPEIADRLAVFTLTSGIDWAWPNQPETKLRSTGNVLTNLMLPIACALANEVRIGGCDGRNPNENYFWRHNPARQYDDDLMGSAFRSNPGFFKYRVYKDYYATHCAELENLISNAEAEGRRIYTVTPSFIPALAERAV